MTSACTRRRLADLGCVLALALLALPALALESDRDQPMDIEAIDSDSDLNTGVLKLIGGVKINQGSLKINAETGEVHRTSEASDISRVILEGAPTCLEQDLDNAAGKMRACSSRLEYDIASESVVLTGNVRIEEPRGTLTGERVTYDIAQGRVQGQSGGGDSRVRFVIPPRARKPDSENP
jgi:lipopolysaccharide export system protein LptA